VAAETNYYDVLGVPSDADHDQIRKAFRERVRACHPDRVANLDEDLRKLAEEKMVGLNEAYAVLRNPARRAAYDDRKATTARGNVPVTPPSEGPIPAPPTGQAAGRSGDPLIDTDAARNRIGEQHFVARAASEEFQHSIKAAVSGNVTWTPVALRGTTLALRGDRGRKSFYFALMAAPRLDDKRLRRFLGQLETWSDGLKTGILGRTHAYGFAAAVEFAEQERLRKVLDQFNRRRKARDKLGEATLIDLVNWHVAPGDTGLVERLDQLLKGR